MLGNSEQEQRYLVLNICKGLRFDCLNNVMLRISTVFRNKRLTSKYIRAAPNPNFDVTFIWCTTARHINMLQKWCSHIEVAICATSAGKTWTAGCAMIGIHHAQVLGPDFELSTQRFSVCNMKTKTHTMLRPELVVTLSIRSEPPLNIDSQLHLANLSKWSRPVSLVDEMVRSYTSSATTKTKKGQEVKSQESVIVLAQPYLYHKQQIERNQNGSPKTKECHSVSRYRVVRPEKRAMNMQRSRQIRTPPLPPQRTFEPLPKICWTQQQRMYKIIREARESKDCDENSLQMSCSSTDTEQEVPKWHDRIPPLPNNMNIPSRIRLIVQNVRTSSMTSLGDYSSGSTSEMIDQPVESHDCTPTISAQLNNVEIPSRIHLMVQNIDKSKMASLGVYGSSSTFQMIGQPPPTRKHIVKMHTLYYDTPAPQKNWNILKIRNSNSNVLMVSKTIETKEEDIDIQESHDQTPAPPASAPPASAPPQTISSKTNVNIKKSVWLKGDTANVNCKEDTDLKQC